MLRTQTVVWALFTTIMIVAPTLSAQHGTAPEGMILIPAGEFRMGSAGDDPHAEADEKPQRIVNVPAFYIDKFEVSNIEYKRFLDDTHYPAPERWVDGNYREGTDFYPVSNISWWEAGAYAQWAGKRLPTEAEWEKAARGADARRYPWGDEFDPDLANATAGFLPVTAHLEGASVYGVVNMAGNVAEWTASVYERYPTLSADLPSEFGGTSESGDKPKSRSADDDKRLSQRGKPPREDDPLLQFFTVDQLLDGRERVYRGGSVNNYTQFLRCANREHASPRDRWYNIGFRCARDVDAPQSAPGPRR